MSSTSSAHSKYILVRVVCHKRVFFKLNPAVPYHTMDGCSFFRPGHILLVTCIATVGTNLNILNAHMYTHQHSHSQTHAHIVNAHTHCTHARTHAHTHTHTAHTGVCSAQKFVMQVSTNIQDL